MTRLSCICLALTLPLWAQPASAPASLQLEALQINRPVLPNDPRSSINDELRGLATWYNPSRRDIYDLRTTFQIHDGYGEPIFDVEGSSLAVLKAGQRAQVDFFRYYSGRVYEFSVGVEVQYRDDPKAEPQVFRLPPRPIQSSSGGNPVNY